MSLPLHGKYGRTGRSCDGAGRRINGLVGKDKARGRSRAGAGRRIDGLVGKDKARGRSRAGAEAYASELITAEELPQRGLILGGLGRLRVNTDQNPRRTINEVLRSAEQVTMCLQIVTQAAVQIQRQFRLWKWRKDVVWNPYTDDGRNQLLWKARIFIKELHLQ